MIDPMIGNVLMSLLLIAGVARFFPYQTETNKDAMCVNNERIWK